MLTVANLFRSIQAFLAAQQTSDELNALSDQELRDIGLTRYDISGVVTMTRQGWIRNSGASAGSIYAMSTRVA